MNKVVYGGDDGFGVAGWWRWPVGGGPLLGLKKAKYLQPQGKRKRGQRKSETSNIHFCPAGYINCIHLLLHRYLLIYQDCCDVQNCPGVSDTSAVQIKDWIAGTVYEVSYLQQCVKLVSYDSCKWPRNVEKLRKKRGTSVGRWNHVWHCEEPS